MRWARGLALRRRRFSCSVFSRGWNASDSITTLPLGTVGVGTMGRPDATNADLCFENICYFAGRVESPCAFAARGIACEVEAHVKEPKIRLDYEI